jgi:Ni/Fe-hydrogenase subunit HybB-like protein
MASSSALPRPARSSWPLVLVGGVVTAVGLVAAYLMEEHGHAITGMNNQIVWGMPHVFAIYMIVAASGVLNVASVGTVFGKTAYKPHAPLSGLLCLALLAGGLFVLMLDLGRPERLVVAATHYNFTSVFAWNVFLYSGITAIVAVYLWTLMERRMKPYAKPAGVAAFVGRLVLTTGTGSIFAFLVARQAYGSALLPPLFIVLSFAWGLAAFLLAQAGFAAWTSRKPDPEAQERMRRLLAVLVSAALYFALIYHFVNAYFARQQAFERFLLLDGGVYPLLFWGGFVLVGGIVPLALLWRSGAASHRSALAASLLVTAGAFAWLYAFIIGGQAFPLEIFPGYTASSSFADGQIQSYAPSLPEVALGIGGLGLAFLIAVAGAGVLPFLPDSADDAPATTGIE